MKQRSQCILDKQEERVTGEKDAEQVGKGVQLATFFRALKFAILGKQSELELG